MGKWRLIKTAPKDKPVLLFVESSIIEAQWYEQVDNSGEKYGPGYWDVVRLSPHGCGCCSSELDEPTHWMPLPTSPETNP